MISNVLSFINFIVLPKNFKGDEPTKKFSDRKDILEKILCKINNKSNVIKITGYPFSGKSELLKYLYKISTKKKILLNIGIDTEIAKKYIKRVGRVYYIDWHIPENEIDVLKKELKNLKYSKYKNTIILMDNIGYIDNPTNILELLFSKERENIFVIYTIDFEDPTTIPIKSFSVNDIHELALKYDLMLSVEEENNIYLSTQGNIGLITLILNNYTSQHYLAQLNVINDISVSTQAQRIINGILKDEELKKLAVLCATLNVCEDTFDATKLSQMIGYNISTLDLEKLKSTGLFFQKSKSTYYSNNYISQIIRSIDSLLVDKIVLKLIKYYAKKKNAKALSILLLCKSELTNTEISQIKNALVDNSVIDNIVNLNFIMKIGQVFKENQRIDFSATKKLKDLKEELIYQYAYALLYVGNYKEAYDIVEKNDSDKLLYLKADLAHLQNNYDNAIGLYTIIINNKSVNYEMANIKLAHCYKHEGAFQEALTMLVNIENNENMPFNVKLRSKTDSLSLYILLNDFTALDNKIQEINLNLTDLKEYQLATLKRYNAVLFAYRNSYELAMEEINFAIDICNKTNSRLKYNCYYIRGEINRHYRKYRQALKDFIQCYKVTLWNEDYNLRSMAVVAVELIKNESSIDILDYDMSKLLKICNQNNMPYNAKLLEILLQHKISNIPISENVKNAYLIVP